MKPRCHDRLDQAARDACRRAEQAERDPEPSLAQRFAQIGVLGWMIVIPILGGLWLGRWLDGALETGLMFSAAGLTAGAAFGMWSAWRWMHQQ